MRITHRKLRPVFGVDFSGAADAGRKIWIAAGTLDADGALHIERCQPVAALPGGGVERETALAALRALIAGQPQGVFGVDFPAGLPRALVNAPDWVAFALGFARTHPDPAAFRDACRRAAGGRDLKRRTDVETRTPFSPYNLRLYRQTYFGVRDVLAPLVRDGAAAVAPMQRPARGRPLLLEVCPASLLKAGGLYRPYKGRSSAHRAARRRICEAVCASDGMSIEAPVRRRVAADTEGDALDSVLAAVAVARALRRPRSIIAADATYRMEGMVYC